MFERGARPPRVEVSRYSENSPVRHGELEGSGRAPLERNPYRELEGSGRAPLERDPDRELEGSGRAPLERDPDRELEGSGRAPLERDPDRELKGSGRAPLERHPSRRVGRRFSLEGSGWRRMAQWGCVHGPDWFVRLSPPLIGLVICFLAPRPRRRVLENLRRVRGARGPWRDGLDALRTFAAYASCLAETLSVGATGSRMPSVEARGDEHIDEALRGGRGVVIVTAHTAGWEVVGSSLLRRCGVPVMIVEEAESDPATAGIQDAARSALGVVVAHVGDDPLSALAIVRHLRSGGIVALQVDRVRRGMRAIAVSLFGAPAMIPVGPAMISMLTGAPIVPLFASRVGFRRYEVEVGVPVRLVRGAPEAEVAEAMQGIAAALDGFVRRHPTQWFHFRGE